jgi:hypothetical protein
LTLTVTNPNPGLSERMPIGITLDNELILFHLSGLGTGPLSGNCGPFWGTTCRLPAIGTQPRKLTFIVVAPRSARSGTLSVTIDQTTRSNTFGVSPPPATDALGLTLGPPAESAAESAPTTTRSADGDLNADAELAPGPRNTGASSMASPSDEHSATSAPPTSGGSATTTAPPTASWPATTGSTNTTSAAPPPPGDAVPVGGTDLPQTSATIGTGAPPDVPPSGEALATTGPPGTPEETGAGDPVTTAPAPANVRLSAPRGGEQFSPGGALALSFTATNNGGARSAATPIILALPDGVEVERVTVDGSAACATGGGCLLPALQPGGEVHVTVELSAGAGASGGAALITVDGSGVGWRVNVWSPASPPTDQRTTNQPAAEPTTSQRATDPQPTGIVTSH